jgi:competence CoiA-like predicted nuclease
MNFAAEKEVMEMMEMVQEYLQKFKCPVVGKQVILKKCFC